MCVLPGRLRFNDDASERAAGTAPPAHGEIVQSGAGSGQYALRSTCASAAPGSASTRATVTTRVLMRRNLPAHPPPGAGQVIWYSGPSPPSGVVSRPPFAVIAPHCTQFV